MLDRIEWQRWRCPLATEDRACDDIVAPGVEGVGEDAFLWFGEEILLIVQAWRIRGDEDGFSLQAR